MFSLIWGNRRHSYFETNSPPSLKKHPDSPCYLYWTLSWNLESAGTSLSLELSKINLSSTLQSHSLWKSKALPMDSSVSRSQDHPSLPGSCDLTCRLCSELPQPRHKTELVPHLPKKKKKKCTCACVSVFHKDFGNRGALVSSSLPLTLAADPRNVVIHLQPLSAEGHHPTHPRA